MGKVSDQVVFAVGFIFHSLFMALHGGLDLHDLGGNLCVGRGKHIIGVKVVVHIGMKHAAGFGNGLAHLPLSVKMGRQIDGKGPEGQHDQEKGEHKLLDFRPVWAVGVTRSSLLRVILGLYKKIMFCQPVKERTVKDHICQIIDAESQP